MADNNLEFEESSCFCFIFYQIILQTIIYTFDKEIQEEIYRITHRLNLFNCGEYNEDTYSLPTSCHYTRGDDSSGTEWYEEPVTIVGFVAGFLLLVLVIASILILCHSSEEDEEDEEDAAPQRNGGLEDVKTEERWTEFEHDRTNPLYINANEFPLQTTSLRASYVHIHVDGGTPNDGFQAYYNR